MTESTPSDRSTQCPPGYVPWLTMTYHAYDVNEHHFVLSSEGKLTHKEEPVITADTLIVDDYLVSCLSEPRTRTPSNSASSVDCVKWKVPLKHNERVSERGSEVKKWPAFLKDISECTSDSQSPQLAPTFLDEEIEDEMPSDQKEGEGEKSEGA